MPSSARAPAAANAPPHVDTVDTQYLESLVGYNARRAALAIIAQFIPRMAPYDLTPVTLSVLSLVAHNPGITSRQLCSTLNILPPNLVGMVAQLEKRGVIERLPHPHDRRAAGLHLTPDGEALVREAELRVSALEEEATARLTAAERKTLMRLLQKVYR
jgi:DNA-binding MarR family transcriptional regulator